MLKIGSLSLPLGLTLAPMAGVTDDTFRSICKRFGAEYMVSEMISAKGLHYGDKKTEMLAHISRSQRPVGLQIFGSDPAIMAEAACILYERYHPEVIDINMGCPMRKIVTNGDGSALMRQPALAERVIRTVHSALPEIPLTVKIRTGWDANSVNAPEFAKMAEQAGAAALCIHGRTREQLYAPPIDYRTIAEVKRAVSIPVIGNGGILTAADAKRMFDCGCDGIAIGQGACGNPWIFTEISASMNGLPYTPPTPADKVNLALLHAAELVRVKGEHIGIAESRKHIAWYLRGMNGAAAARSAVNSCTSLSQIQEILIALVR